ncbi:MAG: hypothetical protein ACC662_07715, partial [Planctomycetota bacterium]
MPDSTCFRRPRVVLLAAFVVGLLVVPCRAARAQDPASDFKNICSSCHTIGGGRLVGPDLKDVTKQKDRAWLARFIIDPGAVIDSGDPYAAKLLEEARNVRMANIPGMDKARAEGLLDLIEAESKLEKSRFAGVQISMRPFTEQDVAHGRGIFEGTTRLANGGPPCISCHTTGGVGGLGGGRLGPDLTQVFERYENRRKLGTWLSAPATQTMRPTFQDHPLEEAEILFVLAYFEHEMKSDQGESAPRTLLLVLLGLGGAL